MIRVTLGWVLTCQLLLAFLTAASTRGAEERIDGPAIWGSRWVNFTPEANVIHDSSAYFWHDGMSYRLFSTSDLLGTARSHLELAIGELQDSPSLDCFYRKLNGTPSDLNEAGFGDIASNVPRDFALTEFSLIFYRQPNPNCGVPAPALPLPRELHARFESPGNDFISFVASPSNGPNDRWPARTSSAGLTWSGQGLEWSVSGVSTRDPFGIPLLIDLATSFDPSFSFTCRTEKEVLHEATLASFGLRSPAVPAGFHLRSRSLTAETVKGACPSSLPRYRDIDLFWYFESDDGMAIEIGGRFNGDSDSDFDRIEGEDYLRWKTGTGIQAFVRGYSLYDSNPLSMNELIEVAASFDRALGRLNSTKPGS